MDALRRGEAAQALGDNRAARAWFARARRIVPSEPAVAFALANAMLNLQDPAARPLFAQAAQATDTREAWLGLSAACWQAGDGAGAAAALAAALSRHVLPEPLAPMRGLADSVASMVGKPDWCGLAAAPPGRSLRLVTGQCAPIEILVDGQAHHEPNLPSTGIASISRDGQALLGSPIDLARMRRSEGFVETIEGGLQGWIWVPSDPDHDPAVRIIAAGETDGIVRVASDTTMQAQRPLARPRRFSVPAADLAPDIGLIHVLGPDGRDLAGSPLDPTLDLTAARWIAEIAAAHHPATGLAHTTAAPEFLPIPAAIRGPPATAPAAPRRPVAIVIPVYRNLALTRACLESVFASCPESPVIVIDDATPERELGAALDVWSASERITLLRHAKNKGFPAAANAGLRAAFALEPPHDTVLLNSDTLLPSTRPGAATWLERLRGAVHAAPDIGTATPLSNDATILSYPHHDKPNPPPDAATLARLDAQAARANPAVCVEIPTAVGFCMYIRRECAIATGLFRTALFAQGYGEENDFCRRANVLGWRHVAVPGVVVGHVGGASFGAAREALITRNLAVLERLHPGYHQSIAAWQARIPAEDALAPARRRLDALRWATGRKPNATLLVTHDKGGGVERVVQSRVNALRQAGARAILLRPVGDPESDGGSIAGLCRVDDGAGTCPNLIFRLPEELPALAKLLRADRPNALEVHHRIGHHPSVMELATRLALPLDLHLHDYASFCPRISLLGTEQRYCGEPAEIAVCQACVADAGSRLEEAIDVAALRQRSAAEFHRARAIIVPSADMASRMRRHFPSFAAVVTALEPTPARPPSAAAATLPRRICVIGAIGLEKGYDVLLACARDAASRSLPLEFTLVGRSTDDDRLIETGRVFITGQYDEADAEALVRAQSAHLAFLPSIWPETWGFTLGLAWRAGLRAVVFDIGAMAARVRGTGFGLILPLGLPPAAVNNALLSPAAAAPAAR